MACPPCDLQITDEKWEQQLLLAMNVVNKKVHKILHVGLSRFKWILFPHVTILLVGLRWDGCKQISDWISNIFFSLLFFSKALHVCATCYLGILKPSEILIWKVRPHRNIKLQLVGFKTWPTYPHLSPKLKKKSNPNQFNSLSV
jgi:hypothetical protein